jgi:hypothetical protein
VLCLAVLARAAAAWSFLVVLGGSSAPRSQQLTVTTNNWGFNEGMILTVWKSVSECLFL